MRKEKAQVVHARNRFEQRCGIRFSRRLNKKFVRQIQTHNDVKLVEKRSLRVSIWNVWHESVKYTVVYDKIRKNIVTVLGREE
jgi:hypothetical protein